MSETTHMSLRLLEILREHRATVQKELDAALTKKQRLLDDLTKTTEQIQLLTSDLIDLDEEIEKRALQHEQTKEIRIREEPDPYHPISDWPA